VGSRQSRQRRSGKENDERVPRPGVLSRAKLPPSSRQRRRQLRAPSAAAAATRGQSTSSRMPCRTAGSGFSFVAAFNAKHQCASFRVTHFWSVLPSALADSSADCEAKSVGSGAIPYLVAAWRLCTNLISYDQLRAQQAAVTPIGRSLLTRFDPKGHYLGTNGGSRPSKTAAPGARYRG
jgi:hypothetical protein